MEALAWRTGPAGTMDLALQVLARGARRGGGSPSRLVTSPVLQGPNDESPLELLIGFTARGAPLSVAMASGEERMR